MSRCLSLSDMFSSHSSGGLCQVRTGIQPQDREGAGSDRAADIAHPRRMSAFGHKVDSEEVSPNVLFLGERADIKISNAKCPL
jgi:hypothetical protein